MSDSLSRLGSETPSWLQPPAAPIQSAAAGPSALPSPVPTPRKKSPGDARGAEKPARDDDAASNAPPMTVMLESAPPWLVSMVFHMMLMIAMALIVYVQIPRNPVQLDAGAIAPDNPAESLDGEPETGVPMGSVDGEAAIFTPSDLPPVDDPLASPGKVEVRPGGHLMNSDVQAPEIGYALSGRQQGSSWRKALLGHIGNPDVTEAAVRRGLEWLARNQRADGSWSLLGPYDDGAPKYYECEAAATAMALLAFQGDGNTHIDGKYQKNVAKAWNWLLKQQDAAGCFFQTGGVNFRFYTQGQCTIAICELYGMTKDTKFKPPAQLAVNYCLRSQSPEGGWRYSPNIDNDVSVTGWILMALQSAKMAGLSVPDEKLQNIGKFLDSVAVQGGSRYPYQKDGDIRRSITAEALLMREYLGWKRTDQRLVDGVNWITSPENLIDFKNNRDVYYWYYASQAARHFGERPRGRHAGRKPGGSPH